MSKNQIQSGFIAIVSMIVITFVIVAMLTTAGNFNRFSSTAVHEWTAQMQSDLFLHLMSSENRYYLEANPEIADLNVASVALELTTQLNLEDPRTFLGREIPGFSAFDDRLVVAGEGTDLTTMSIESSPPPDAFTTTDEEEESSQVEDEGEERNLMDEEAIVHIVHTHNREAFHPYSDGQDYDTEDNIVEVGKHLGEQFQEHGIPVEVNEDDIHGSLLDQGLHFSRSYDLSRDVLVEAIERNDNLEFFLDIHRDSQPRDITTATVNGEPMARLFFVVGTDHPEYERNLNLATEMHYRIEEEYPGLSRGVLERGGSGVDGVYNQDLSPNAMLIEFGGIQNNFEELNRSAEAVGDIIADYIYEQVEGEVEQ
ncbi:LOW QUALITY PROTEIN: stage II sporulation protein P [Geomicrobium sp. JCM 19039]|nr:LOW QUALITY PROTEIN: stage II sporulation protein P [Geomicrobium sp. JCM 19039]